MWKTSMRTRPLLQVSLLTVLMGSAASMEGPRPEPPPPPDDALVQRVEERVEMLRKWRVLEAVDPSEEVADRLLPLLSTADRQERELDRQRERLTNELRTALDREPRNEAKLRDIIAGLDDGERERCRVREERNQQLAQMLTVQQRARLVIALDEFHREVRELIGRVRRPPEDRPGDRPPPIE